MIGVSTILTILNDIYQLTMIPHESLWPVFQLHRAPFRPMKNGGIEKDGT